MLASLKLEPSLNVPQARFIAMERKFKAFVAGFGSGKTFVGCAGLCKHFWEFPGVNAGYFAPTYGHIRDIFYPTIEEVVEPWGLNVKIAVSNKEAHIYEGKRYRGTIICRTMDKPGDIVGFKIGHALIDELDIMKVPKAQVAWTKIIARMRYKVDGLRNGIDVTTTPEGFKFVYKQFVKDLRDQPESRQWYGLVQASTYDNAANLPADYIPSLRQSYSAQLIDAYLDGKFVNLASGSVYPEFSRTQNYTDAHMQPGEPLHIGMDFNVLNMTAIICVVRDGLPLVVGELTKVRDTPAMCKLLKERFPDRVLTIYPDASGQNTSTKNANESDHTLLRQAGFIVTVNGRNPSVRDRINAMNGMLLNAEGQRRMMINTDLCPALTECLEQQCYDTNSEPDKGSGFDHANDALGYFITMRYPIMHKKIVQAAPIPTTHHFNKARR